MKKVLIFTIIIFPIYLRGQSIECFTHPFANTPISLYSEPYIYLNKLYVSGEAGYEVIATQKESDYILICDFYDESELGWVMVGDLGIVIQNYVNDLIPIYSSPDYLSTIQTYLTEESYIAILYDWTTDFAKIKIEEGNLICLGWIDRKYLCGSPYTTCN